MKRLISVFAVLVAVVLVVGVVVFFSIDGLARRGIERGASYATGTSSRLQSAHLSMRQGELTLRDFEIGNPEGFDGPHFMKLGEGDVMVTLRSLLRDEVEVPRLHLKGVNLNLERRDGRNNYDVILENLEKLRGPPEDQPETGKKYMIREVVISDIVVNASLRPFVGEPRVITVELDDIRLTDVGSDTDHGVLLTQVSGTIMNAVLRAAIQQHGDALPAVITEGLKEGLAGMGELGGFGLETIDGRLREGVERIFGGGRGGSGEQ